MDTTTRRWPPLHWLMLAGFVIGLAGGLWVNLSVGPDAGWVQWVTANVTGPLGQIFLRLLFMLVLPLLFSALVIGVAEMGDLIRFAHPYQNLTLTLTPKVIGSP